MASQTKKTAIKKVPMYPTPKKVKVIEKDQPEKEVSSPIRAAKYLNGQIFESEGRRIRSADRIRKRERLIEIREEISEDGRA